MLILWELDECGHLNYTQTASLNCAAEYIKWHDEMQTAILTAVAESSGLEPDNIKWEYPKEDLLTN